MKFKEFLNKKSLPVLYTVFGRHSNPPHASAHLPALYTSFGGDRLNESVLPPRFLDSHEEEIHLKNSIKHHPSIKKYTDHSADINNALRRHHEKQQIDDDIIEDIHSLDSVLDHAKTDRNLTLYTSLYESPVHYWTNGDKNGSTIVHLPAYTSTSTKYVQARKFAKFDDSLDKTNKVKHLLKIDVPPKSKGGSVMSQSENPLEYEFLLHRGHNLRIDHKPEIKTDGTHIWSATVLGHDPNVVN